MPDPLTHWHCAIEDVPMLTGASTVMDLSDLKPVFEALEIDMSNEAVLDVGCGTGRLSKACLYYLGLDVSPSMVAYCDLLGIPARLIYGAHDVRLYGYGFDRVTCLSVFTHVSRTERQSYLNEFRTMVRKLLVDILPGQEGGDVGSWFANVEDFESDLAEFGWDIKGVYEQKSPDGALHRYYECALQR